MEGHDRQRYKAWHRMMMMMMMIPCCMDKNSGNLILKKKFYLFVAHHYKIGNHFSVAGMPSFSNNHIMAYSSHRVNQTLNIGMGIVNHLSIRLGLVVDG